MSDNLVIAGRKFRSRLIVGTGKYESFEVMRQAMETSGADLVTVAVRRVNLTDKSKESSAGPYRSRQVHAVTQYRRLLYGARCHSLRPFGAGGRALGPGQA